MNPLPTDEQARDRTQGTGLLGAARERLERMCRASRKLRSGGRGWSRRVRAERRQPS